MCAKYLPFSNTKPSYDCFSFLCAELGVGINRGHKYRCISVILCLLGRQTVNIDINIPCDSDMLCIVDQNYLPGQMTAFSFIDLEMKLLKIEKSYLRQRLGQVFNIIPESRDLFGIRGDV